MEKNRIVIGEWGPGNEKSSNRGIYIGRYQGQEESHGSNRVYGICLETFDPFKDCKLHGYSLHPHHIGIPFAEVQSKKQIRELLIKNIDKALDHLFSEESSKEADEYTEHINSIFENAAMIISQEEDASNEPNSLGSKEVKLN
jgi:hypothetical protein